MAANIHEIIFSCEFHSDHEIFCQIFLKTVYSTGLDSSKSWKSMYHENMQDHENIRPWKFGAIRYIVIQLTSSELAINGKILHDINIYITQLSAYSYWLAANVIFILRLTLYILSTCLKAFQY